MSSTGRVSKRVLEQKKTDARNNKAETIKNKTAKKQKLEALRKEAQDNPEKQNEIEAMNNEITDIETQEQVIEVEEKRLNEMTPMEIEDDALQPQLEREDVSPAAQVSDPVDQAEEDPSRNKLSQGGGGDNNMDKENNGDNETSNANGNGNGNGNGNLENTASLTPFSNEIEEDELPVMTVSAYKNLMGRPTTDSAVVAWKPGGGRRGDTVIKRYGPKSHPIFRIENAFEGFDPTIIPDITEPNYRIGELKTNRTWSYDYKHVDGIVAVAFKPKDDEEPLDTIDPAWYAKNPKARYAETQVLIQWKEIDGWPPKPRTWETRTTARRVCPMRGKKGEADKMFFERAKQCEVRHAIWLGDKSKGRDSTMTPAPVLVKTEEGSEAEVESIEVAGTPAVEESRTTREPRSKSVAFIEPEKSSQPSSLLSKSTEKNSQPKEANSAPGPEVGAAKKTQATSAPPLDMEQYKKEWLADYCELYGSKEEMDDNDRVRMVNAWKKAKESASASA